MTGMASNTANVHISSQSIQRKKGKTGPLILWTAGEISERSEALKCFALQKCPFLKIQSTQDPVNVTMTV